MCIGSYLKMHGIIETMMMNTKLNLRLNNKKQFYDTLELVPMCIGSYSEMHGIIETMMTKTKQNWRLKMKQEMRDNLDFITLNTNIDDLDYIIGRMEYKWRLDKDIEYHMRQDDSCLRKSPKSRAILTEIPRTEFDCRTINNPFELIKLGYTPSKNCWNKFYESNASKVHANDYDVDEELQKVA